MDKSIVENLNQNQKEAVECVDGPAVVLAGAGSGKTRVLVQKVLNLVRNHGVAADSILMITFTNKAAAEMKARILKALQQKSGIGLGYVGTFHSFCATLLRKQGFHLGIERHFTIYNDDDQSDVIKAILKKLDSKKFAPSFYLNRISAAKNQLIGPERYLALFSDYSATYVAEVYDLYEKELKKNMAVDFDDLIMKAVQLFMKHPQVLEGYQERFRYILVDEFQDTNYAQYVLTRILGSKYKNVTVVGDFSQSIYSWRGADIRNLEKFSQDFPETKVINLEQNYRSTQNILDFAYEVISKNETHPVLQLFTDNEKGEEITFFEADNEQEEAIYIVNQISRLQEGDQYSSFAILYRTNAQSRVIEEALLHYGMPYTLIGGTRFYDRKEIKDVLAYLRLFVNPTDDVAKERVRKLGKRRWDDFRKFHQDNLARIKDYTTVELMERIFTETGYLSLYDPADEEDYSRLENIKELKSVAMNNTDLVDFLEQVALVESEYFEGEKRKRQGEGVRLMTMHQAKGLEFPYVFIVGLEEGILPHSRSVEDIYQLEEERRLFYVAITRAREKLFITYARRRFIFGRRTEAAKSRFIGGGQRDDESISYY